MKGGFSLFSKKNKTIKKKYINGNNYRKIMHANEIYNKRESIMNDINKGTYSQLPISINQYHSNAFMAKELNKNATPEHLREIIDLIEKHNLEMKNKALVIDDTNSKGKKHGLNGKLILPTTFKRRRNNVKNLLQNRYKTKKNMLNNMGYASRNLLNTSRANMRKRALLNSIPNWR
jgi:hypothetical protein